MNTLGTHTVATAAQQAGVPRLVYISTASVTGNGPHHFTTPHPGDHHPTSHVSRTRADAESIILDHGGCALRPHLIYGPGDRWFIPPLATILQHDASQAATWTGTTTPIHRDELAHAILDVALSTNPNWAGSTHNVGTTTSVPFSDIAATITTRILTPTTAAADIPRPPALTAHQHTILTRENTFDSSAFWNLLHRSGPNRYRLSPEDITWYRNRHSAHK